jgi:thymidylate kinase
MKKIAVVGLDGSGKSSVLENLLRNGLSAEVVRPVTYRSNVKTEHAPIGRRLATQVDRLALLGDRYESRFLAGMVYFLIWGGGHKFYEQFYVQKHKPDVLLAERDAIIDGSVYATFYFPWTARLTPVQRVGLTQRFSREMPPDVVLYLDVHAEVAMKRIEESVERKRWDGRKLKPRLHETTSTLRSLRAVYHQTLDVLAGRGSDIQVVNTTPLTLDEVTVSAAVLLDPYLHPLNGHADASPLHDSAHGSPKILVLK